MIELVGYHGTIKTNAEEILRTKFFKASIKNNEWLGKGIYFFTDKKWAIWWAEQQANRRKEEMSILKVKINCEEKYYFDLYEEKNFEKANKEFLNLMNYFNKHTHMKDSEKQCALCEFYRRKYNIKIISYLFFKEVNWKYKKSGGFSRYEKQQQLSVFDNNCISEISLLKD